jgi:hypothetical protein
LAIGSLWSIDANGGCQFLRWSSRRRREGPAAIAEATAHSDVARGEASALETLQPKKFLLVAT